jgi:hypothetical protein
VKSLASISIGESQSDLFKNTALNHAQRMNTGNMNKSRETREEAIQ